MIINESQMELTNFILAQQAHRGRLIPLDMVQLRDSRQNAGVLLKATEPSLLSVILKEIQDTILLPLQLMHFFKIHFTKSKTPSGISNLYSTLFVSASKNLFLMYICGF